MKITKKDYNKLDKAIKQALDNLPNLYDNYQAVGLSDMRYRWDLFHYVNPGPALPFRYLSEYLDDSHIDTALRKITNTK